MNFSAVWNAVQIIAGTVASLPLILYRRVGDNGKEREVDHPLYDVLHNLPNPEMTSFTFREVLQGHLLLHGNAYAQILRDTSGRTSQLWPIDPQVVEVKRDGRRMIYRVRESAGNDKIIAAENMLHIPGMGFDGRMGYSVISKAREALGLGLAMEEFQARFYGQGTNLGGYLQHPGKMSDQAHERLKKSISERHGGLKNAHTWMVLEEGMKAERLGMPLEDAQFLESRTFQVGEIARWFNLPPHKLKELSKATFSNIEQQQIEFVVDSIRPWLVRWEQHIAWKLLSKDERKRLFAEFLIDALLRGDTESRMKAYGMMRQNGVINANDWRRLENMNPIEGKAGSSYWMPLNMVDANTGPAEPKNAEPMQEEDKLPNFELRALRSLKARRRTAEAWKEVFRSVEKDVLSREVPAIRKIAQKTLKTRTTADFLEEMNGYYNGNFRGFLHRRFGGLFGQYGEVIYPLAAEEIGAGVELTDEYRQWLAEYTDHSTNRYIESSRGQLKELAMEHRENDALGEIEKRLGEWEAKRPDKIAELEVVNGECGTAQFVYYAAGFRTVWVTFDESCPYCESLNGRTVSRGENFIPAGVAFQPDGAERPLVTTQNISHPAAHEGCDCSVRAAI